MNTAGGDLQWASYASLRSRVFKGCSPNTNCKSVWHFYSFAVYEYIKNNKTQLEFFFPQFWFENIYFSSEECRPLLALVMKTALFSAAPRLVIYDRAALFFSGVLLISLRR